MSKHEEKQCPRCSNIFECKAGTVLQCQCSNIQLSEEERSYIETKFEGCCCIDCLVALQHEYVLFCEKQH